MAEGQIKWYSEKKGFGFIVSEEHGDVFVHQTGIKEYGPFGFQKDDPVTFELKNTPRGEQAVNVMPLKSH